MHHLSSISSRHKSAFSLTRAACLCALAALFLGTGSPASALQNSSLEVRNPEGTRELGDALRRLSLNSRDLSALIDAGNAALQLGDPTAALGFFARAEEIDPNNGRVKAGLGSALLGSEDPYDALRLFDQAVALGVRPRDIAADRGLAYDLVGKQALAQQDYALALQNRGNNDEVTRRYALSLGIAGRREEAEATLTPLLNRQDVAAWRMRAFILAIDNDMDGAIAISDAMMQPRNARALRPYLRYFPRLTASQQAAAAHFGHFPQEANIGRDNPRIAEFSGRTASAGSSRPVRTSRADAGLIPAGEPLGPSESNAASQNRPVDRSERRRPDAGRSASMGGSNDTVEKVTVADVLTGPERAADAAAARAQPKPQPQVQAEAEPEPGRTDFASLMADFSAPSAERKRDAGAVDITTITPARPKPPEPATPAAPAHPSRHWVQVAGGADISALSYEWRRLSRIAPEAFAGKKGWTTPLNRTNRVLAGPFDSRSDAQAFVNLLAKSQINAFTFTSEDGQEISPLD